MRNISLRQSRSCSCVGQNAGEARLAARVPSTGQPAIHRIAPFQRTVVHLCIRPIALRHYWVDTNEPNCRRLSMQRVGTSEIATFQIRLEGGIKRLGTFTSHM